MASTFTTPLVLTFMDGRLWQLAQHFEFASEQVERIIRIPVGFVTDFASVPRFFWRVLPPVGEYGKAAVVHDYLYQTGLVRRVEADRVFLEGMTALGVSWWKRHLLYRAVRLFGAHAYHEQT